VQDRADNATRFVWLAHTERTGADAALPATPPPVLAPKGNTASKTSLVFWGAGADSPGWLVHCLDEFARREINLTRIESRPMRERFGHYMFFADLQGGLEEPAVGEAVEGLRAFCHEVRVLGSYPAA
jgi:prephenate dehydratase